MVEEQDGSGETRQPWRNLEETHMKMRVNVKSKMKKHLKTLLNVPSLDKCHWQFALILDPSYMNKLADMRELHEIYSVDTRSIVLESMPNFYDYIMAAKLS